MCKFLKAKNGHPEPPKSTENLCKPKIIIKLLKTAILWLNATKNKKIKLHHILLSI